MKFLKKSFNMIYVICFSFIFIIATIAAVKELYLVGLFVIPAVIFLLHFILKKHSQSFPEERITKMWIVIQGISFLVMVFMTYKLQVDLSWDWGYLITTASKYVLEGEYDSVIYYARYPNNKFWMSVLIVLFKIIKFVFPAAQLNTFRIVSIAISVLFMQIAITFIYLTARRIWSPKYALLCGIFTVGCLPFYLYAQFFYTDIPALMLISIAVYIYVRMNQSEKKILYAVIIGVLAGLMYHIKIMGFICFIAFAIDSFIRFKNIRRFLVNIIIYVFSTIMVIVALNIVTASVVKISDSMQEKYEFPYTHWVMLGLNELGCYDVADVVYTASFESYDERVKANIDQIRERTKEKGFIGMLNHILNTKLTRTWGNSCFAGDDYSGRLPLKKNGIMQRLFNVSGDLHWISKIYSGIYHIVVLFGLLISGIMSFVNKREIQLLFCKLTMIGIAVFLSIWECNSRYLLAFLPVMIILASDGWFELLKKLISWRACKYHNQKRVS